MALFMNTESTLGSDIVFIVASRGAAVGFKNEHTHTHKPGQCVLFKTRYKPELACQWVSIFSFCLIVLFVFTKNNPTIFRHQYISISTSTCLQLQIYEKKAIYKFADTYVKEGRRKLCGDIIPLKRRACGSMDVKHDASDSIM